MSTTNEVELKRLLRLLKQIAKLTEHASMCGAFEGGAIDVVERYNLILTRLGKMGIDLDDLFPPLPADASMDRVGVASNLLVAYLKEDEDEERNGAPRNIIIGNLGSLAELDKLKDLGKTIEENLPEWMHRKHASAADASETDTVKATADPMPMPDMSRTNV